MWIRTNFHRIKNNYKRGDYITLAITDCGLRCAGRPHDHVNTTQQISSMDRASDFESGVSRKFSVPPLSEEVIMLFSGEYEAQTQPSVDKYLQP